MMYFIDTCIERECNMVKEVLCGASPLGSEICIFSIDNYEVSCRKSVFGEKWSK